MRTLAKQRSRSLVTTERDKRRSGFTLLELMVAVAVLLIASMGAYTSQITSLGLIKTSRETNIATSELQAAMERVLAQPAGELPGSAVYGHGIPIADFANQHLQDQQIVATYPGFVPGTVPDPLTVVLTITWSDFRGRPRSLRLSSLTV